MATVDRPLALKKMRKVRAKGSNVRRRSCVHPDDVERFAPKASDDLDVAADKAAGFLRWYMPEKFYRPFTGIQMRLIRAVLSCIKYGGDDAQAAPRGSGKTSIIEGLVVYAIFYGLLSFAVIVAATDTLAHDILTNIKHEIEQNDLLADDFPAICDPVRALEGRPQRAISQTYGGEYTLIRWGAGQAIFPTVRGSAASGAIIKTFGILGAIRGTRHLDRRPDFVLIDDPETRKSAESPTEIEDRERAIDRDIAGLSGPDKRIARVALVTLQNPTCLAARLTDRNIKPSFCGQRHRLLVEKPTALEKWLEYISLRQADSFKDDRWGRTAHAFYLEHRELMDAGAVVSDPWRFVAETLPDGSQVQVSTLQAYYDFVADKGEAAARAELDNDPSPEMGPQESGINPAIVASRTNAFPQKEVPAGCTVVVAFIDIGKSWSHWTVQAWQPGGIGFVIDYDVIETFKLGTEASDATVDWAIVQGLRQWRDETAKSPYRCGGEPVPLKRVLIDSGDYTDAVYGFCKEAGPPFYASKGFGRGRFYAGVTNQAKQHYAGDHWYSQVQPNGVKLYGIDSDYWKRWAHERFLTNTYDKEHNFQTGAISLFSPGNFKNRHHTFSHHICAEIWTETDSERGVKAEFKVKDGRNNHWLDATAGACAAAAMCGIKIVGEQSKPKRYVSLDAMAKRAS